MPQLIDARLEHGTAQCLVVYLMHFSGHSFLVAKGKGVQGQGNMAAARHAGPGLMAGTDIADAGNPALFKTCLANFLMQKTHLLCHGRVIHSNVQATVIDI